MGMHAGAFDDAYKTLNAEQKLAVDTVEGPVLVVAGPGTGKTHILTLRVANILRLTQATPDTVLVLTFTESAARTVRRRLMPLVGAETAYKVSVHTFHNFAEFVLSRYREFFPAYADMRLAADVETTLLWRDVLTQEDVKLLRTPKSTFHYLKDLKFLRDDLVRERVTTAMYRTWIDEQEQETLSDDSLKYVKGERKGELNAEGQKKLERYERAREAARLIDAYEALKAERRVYDFTDVLRIVVDGLNENAELKATLQETFQYILADEHQDANALQHALLDAFALDDHPNIFVVGDEKQAVFGFQGADATHFAQFVAQYPRATVVALTQNFRSYQGILDIAHELIQGAPSSLGAHTALTAHRGAGTDGAKSSKGTNGSEGRERAALLAAPDPLAERDQITSLVKAAIAEGVAPHEIAVIALRNTTANLFALHLAAAGVPTLRAGDVDLESRLSVRFLLALMRAVANPSDRASLREALLAPWWQRDVNGNERMPLAERAAFLRRTRDSELTDRLGAEFPEVAKAVNDLQARAAALAPIELFSRILEDSGARDYFIGTPEGLLDVPLVRSLMGLVESMQSRTPGLSFAELMRTLEDAREHGLGGISSSVTQLEGEVTVITAHKAKGMEFERVFVVGLTAREWEKGGRASLIPSPLAAPRERAELVRLLYVALTRAKDRLVFSYAERTGEGRESAPSELIPSNLPQIAPQSHPLPRHHADVDAPDLVRKLTRDYLEKDGLSPSALNEYLDSPSCFFAKRVLKLSEPETPAIAIGNAVHAGIAAYLNAGATQAGASAPAKDADTAGEAAAHAAAERSLRDSMLARTRAFDTLSADVSARLETFFASAIAQRETVAVEKGYAATREVALPSGRVQVQLKGKVDAVLAGSGGECLIDFKTSSTVSKTDREKWKTQIAFYDLLLRASGHAPATAFIVQVGAAEVEEHAVDVNAETRAELSATLDAVLIELLEGKWRAAPANEYDAVLRLFS